MAREKTENIMVRIACENKLKIQWLAEYYDVSVSELLRVLALIRYSEVKKALDDPSGASNVPELRIVGGSK